MWVGRSCKLHASSVTGVPKPSRDRARPTLAALRPEGPAASEPGGTDSARTAASFPAGGEAAAGTGEGRRSLRHGGKDRRKTALRR